MRRTIAIAVLSLWGAALMPAAGAAAAEKFVLRASRYRTKVETVEVDDVAGHRLRLGDALGILVNGARGGFLDAAQYAVKTIADEGPGGGIAMGYMIFTTADGAKVFARFEGRRAAAGAPAEGTFEFTGGTGRFRGIEGRGTWRAVGVGPGLTCDHMEGEYELPKSRSRAAARPRSPARGERRRPGRSRTPRVRGALIAAPGPSVASGRRRTRP